MGLLGGVFLKTGSKQPHTMPHPPPFPPLSLSGDVLHLTSKSTKRYKQMARIQRNERLSMRTLGSPSHSSYNKSQESHRSVDSFPFAFGKCSSVSCV